jgi:O-antigen ligase
LSASRDSVTSAGPTFEVERVRTRRWAPIDAVAPLSPPSQVAIGSALAGGAGVAASTGHGSLLLLAAGAVVAGAALLRWPALTVLALLLICEEVEPGEDFGAGGSGLLFLGHQLYFTNISRISLLTLVMVVACARVALVTAPRPVRSVSLFLMVLMGFWYAATVWIGGSALTSAINQDARFALLFVLAFVIGTWAGQQGDWKWRSLTMMRWGFSIVALIGAYLAATGQGQAQTGVNIIFYDSSLGAFAGAVVLAVALAPRAIRTPRVWWLGGAALLVVVLSSRRNVWAAMVFALLIGLVVARQRARLVMRGLAAVTVILLAAAVLAPSVLTELGHEFSAIWQATQGSAADTSTKGHLSDISVGVKAVLAHPIQGIGANGHLPGLVVETPGPLYIHNQILESWLRFGIVGGLLVIALQVSLAARAVSVLRQRSDDISRSWGALLLLMAPVAMLTAPFLTTTQRWPSLIGFAAGLIAAPKGAGNLPVRGAEPALRGLG